ncbi:MAG: DNA polymerase-3 subunit epsilon [Limisphaerales bacterium]|jgi:DNA polymerase-3 subunit epsilon
MRQVVLDTETTGLEVSMGHRIIEIGAVEMIDRKLTGRHFHEYINPQREIDDGALEVHGITQEFLKDKPVFGDIAQSFVQFVEGSDLVIHNAVFDISFLDFELKNLQNGQPKLATICGITDSLALAREKHPGQKNNLDALCRRYMVDNSQRELHGALLDAEILADVYLFMTGGQTALFGQSDQQGDAQERAKSLSLQHLDLKPILASVDEIAAHEEYRVKVLGL